VTEDTVILQQKAEECQFPEILVPRRNLLDPRLDLSLLAQVKQKCTNNAPHIFYINSNGKARIQQGCCNSWLCPRCGPIRARTESERFRYGANCLAAEGHVLYFLTMTCRGKEMSLAEAMAGYGKWTNTYLTACRTQARRSGQFWAYGGVTEHQKRGHPHSHLLTTFCPPDAVPTMQNGREALASQWLVDAAVRAGLGNQVKISAVRNIYETAGYLCKYFFKTAMIEEWPPNFKRVRYSNSWPGHWLDMERLDVVVKTDSDVVMDAAEIRLIKCVKKG